MDDPRVRSPRASPDQTRLIVSEVLFTTDRRGWLETKLLRPGQVAALLQVSRRTVATWARAGLIASIATPGGHRRFRASDVHGLVQRLTVTPARIAR